MKSIPTLRDGLQFRSRLEAKWATFFDLIGWRWSYEPIDFNGWIPDFALYGKKEIIYVEVKPVVTFPEETSREIDKSGCKEDVLIVGQVVPLPESEDFDWGNVYVGWLGQHWEEESNQFTHAWDLAVLGRWEAGKGQIGFCHNIQSFHDRISNGYDGGSCGRLQPVILSEIKALWNASCNATQWRR